MRIAIAQMGSRAGELQKTVTRMLDFARQAHDRGAELVVFPMAALTGPVPAEFADQEGFLLDLSETFALLCEEAPCACIVPVVTEVDSVPEFEAVLVNDGNVTPLKATALIERGQQDARDDQDAPAPDLPEFEVSGLRLGLAFTYEDLDDYDDFEFDVDAIVFASGYGYAVDDPSSAMGGAITEARFRTDAETCGAWIIGVGSVGGYGSQVFCGSSFVLAPWGELAALAPAFEEALVTCDVDASSEGPLAHPLVPEVYDRSLTLWGALSAGLSDFVAESGATGASLVLDGSLNSALLATLASDALGPTNVHALLAPPTRDTMPACADLARSLRIDATQLDRTTLDAHDAAFARDLVEARLAALARSTSSVALSSADKTALALEDLTHAVRAATLAPLGDVYRSDVIELARLRNTISPVIPASMRDAFDVCAIEGVGEVSTSRVQQVEFIDYVLASHIEWQRCLSDVVESQGHGEVSLGVFERYESNELSRRLAPPSLLVSSRSLADAAKPLGFAWRDKRREKGERVDEKALGELADAIGEAVKDSEDVSLPTSDDMRRTLEFLRDFAQGGGLSPQGFGNQRMPDDQGKPSDGLWANPFSEN